MTDAAQSRCQWPLLLLSGALLSSCLSIGPDYVPPKSALPAAWTQPLGNTFVTDSHAVCAWWEVFADPILTSLVDQTRSSNLSLQTAWERLQEARADYGYARADLYPVVQGEAGLTRSRLSEKTSPGATPNPRNIWNTGLSSSWEIDFWGRVRRQVEAGAATMQATQENYRDTMVLLFSSAAAEYVTLRTLQQRLEFARENAELQEATLKLTRDRFHAELARELDVHQAEMNLAVTRSMQPGLLAQIDACLNRLCQLTGQPPESLPQLRGSFRTIPTPVGALPTLLPADLLRQRPDIRLAERQLAAQTAGIGAAKAELLPQFSLSGNFGWQAASTGDILSGPARTYGFGPTLRWDIFSGMRILEKVRAQEARQRQALLTYQETVLNALQECESNLSAYTHEIDRLRYLQDAVVSAKASVNQVNTLYRTGLTDFQNVLDMQRALTERQDALAESQGQLALSLIAVYRAFGGGWTPHPE